MARDTTVEIIEAVARACSETAKAVAEGVGEGIAKAMGYGQVIQLPGNETVEEELAEFIPDVEKDEWMMGVPDVP